MNVPQRLRGLLEVSFTLFTACLLCGVSPAHAADVLIGQSVELSGEASAKDNKAGADAYFNWVNARGGVNGNKIRVITLDDKRDPKLALENTRILIDEKKVVALFGYRSTPTVVAVLPMVQDRKMSLVAPITGAQALHSQQTDYVFNLRASYSEEAYRIVQQVTTMGITRVAVLFQDDPFGRELLAGFERGIKERQLTTVALASYSRQDMKLDAALTQIAAAAPQAVLMACTPKACAQFVKEMRARGQHPQFVTVSNVNSQDFFTALSGDCGGVAISQVVPHPGNVGVPVVQEFHLVRKSMETPPPLNYAALEGFIGAKLLVEGLKKAGDNPTPAKVAAALDAIKELDLGGLTISYSHHDRVGSRFVELTVLDRDCVIRR